MQHAAWRSVRIGHHLRPGACRLSPLAAADTRQTPDSYGSMIELSWRGTKPLTLSTGGVRKFIDDGDTVLLRGHCSKDGVRIGFGACDAKLLPAVPQ